MNTIPALPGGFERIEDACGKVWHADALALLRALPDNSVDLVLTDPPYGIGDVVSAWRLPHERFSDVPNNNAIYTDWIQGVYRVLCDGSAFYMFASWRNFGQWQQQVEAAGLQVRDCIVWDKVLHGLSGLTTHFAPRHEFVLYAVKNGHKLRGKRPVNVIRVMRQLPDKLIHPYEKPIALLEQLISASSDVNDIILDPFAGSGTTAVAARNLNRRWIAGDITAEYVQLAEKRLAQPYTPNMFETLLASSE